MDLKEQAVRDHDTYRELLARFERYAKKAMATAETLKTVRLDITGDDARKAALKAIVDQTPDSLTTLVDRGKLAGTVATYLAGKYPDLATPPPPEPAEEPPAEG